MDPVGITTHYALSTTQSVLDWIQSTKEARILHVFEPACNLINSKGDIISIVNPMIGNGPFNMIVPTINFQKLLHDNSPISIGKTSISLGTMNISVSRKKIWHPKPDWKTLREESNNITSFLNPIEKLLLKESPQDSFARILFPPTDNNFPVNIYEVVQETLADIKIILSNKEMDDLADIAARIAGLDGGLTPAGDDFLMGLIHGL